jgi:hypothetical protein
MAKDRSNRAAQEYGKRLHKTAIDCKRVLQSKKTTAKECGESVQIDCSKGYDKSVGKEYGKRIWKTAIEYGTRVPKTAANECGKEYGKNVQQSAKDSTDCARLQQKSTVKARSRRVWQESLARECKRVWQKNAKGYGTRMQKTAKDLQHQNADRGLQLYYGARAWQKAQENSMAKESGKRGWQK